MIFVIYSLICTIIHIIHLGNSDHLSARDVAFDFGCRRQVAILVHLQRQADGVRITAADDRRPIQHQAAGSRIDGCGVAAGNMVATGAWDRVGVANTSAGGAPADMERLQANPTPARSKPIRINLMRRYSLHIGNYHALYYLHQS